MIRNLSFAVLAICAAAFIASPCQSMATTLNIDAFQRTTLETYDYPRIVPEDPNYKLKANDQDVFVYHTSAGPFAAFSCDGPVMIEIVLANIGGTAFEFGHELTTDSITDVRFINCDVLGVHDHGGVFGIHNADRAVISNILFENIRVEHYYNKLIDMRIIKSRFHRDETRGQVRDIVFRNIDVSVSRYNPGYSISLIGGYDENHTVENVVFDNFRLNGEKVINADQLDLFIKHTKNVIFYE